jgi:hypothetical protein
MQRSNSISTFACRSNDFGTCERRRMPRCSLPYVKTQGEEPLLVAAPRSSPQHLEYDGGRQIRPDVDQARSQSRKTGKIASRDVARSRINWISACQHRAA